MVDAVDRTLERGALCVVVSFGRLSLCRDFSFSSGQSGGVKPRRKTLVIEKTGYAQEKISPDARMYRYQESWDAVEDDD